MRRAAHHDKMQNDLIYNNGVANVREGPDARGKTMVRHKMMHGMQRGKCVDVVARTMPGVAHKRFA